MDNVSHSLAGWALARAAGPTRPAGTTLTLVLASNLPDLDFVLMLRSEAAYLLYHRGFSHSLLGLAVLPWLLAGGLAWAYAGRTRFRWLLLLGYVGVGLHLIYDVVTSWGTMLLYPFDLTRFALDWLFIVDLVTWAAALAVVLWTWRRPAHGSRAVAAFGAGLLLYAALAGSLHARAGRAAARAERSAGGQVAEVHVIPRPGAPLRWSAFAVSPADAPEPRIAGYEVAGLPPSARLAARFHRGFDDPWVARALATRDGQAYLWWARVPMATTRVEPARVTVLLRDLRYSRTIVPAAETRAPFALAFEFDPSTGELLDTRW